MDTERTVVPAIRDALVAACPASMTIGEESSIVPLGVSRIASMTPACVQARRNVPFAYPTATVEAV